MYKAVAFLLLIPCLAIFPPEARSQESSDKTNNVHNPYGGVSEHIAGVHVPPIPNSPFTAKVEIESTKTLDDGSTVNEKSINWIARDRTGRTYNERRRLISADSPKEPPLIWINLYDASQQLRARILPSTHEVRLYRNITSPVAPANSATRSGPSLEVQDLGAQTIAGIEAHGTRESRSLKAESVGANQTLVIEDDYWYSAELQINLLVQHHDPRHGRQEVRVTELVLGDPNPRMFKIPPAYKVIDEQVRSK